MTPEEVVAELESVGFARMGETPKQVFRVPTRRPPVLRQSGGEVRLFGGRLRFELVGTSLRATVGPRTVNVYRVKTEGVEFIANWRTRDVTPEMVLGLRLVAAPRVLVPRQPDWHRWADRGEAPRRVETASGVDRCRACGLLRKPAPNRRVWLYRIDRDGEKWTSKRPDCLVVGAGD